MKTLSAIKILWSTFGKYRWHVLALVVLGFVSAIVEGIGINAIVPLMSFFTGGQSLAPDFITRVITGLFAFFSIPFTFRYLLGFVIALFLVRAISQVVFGYIRGWINADFMSNESTDMLQRTLRASWPYLLRQKIGTLNNTLVRDIQCTSALLNSFGQVIQSFSGLLMYLLVAINISPRMTLYTLFAGAILLVFARPLLIRMVRTSDETARTEKRFAQFLTEHIIGMKSIKAAGAEASAQRSGASLLQSLRTLAIQQAFIKSASSSLFQPFSIVFVVVLFAVTYRSPDFSIISFAATLYLIQKIFTYLESGQSALHGIGEMLPYARNLSEYKRNLSHHEERRATGEQPFVFEHSLAFDAVSFYYDKERPILKDVRFSIKRGTTVALIGPSGAGKTTVADILLRLFEPAAGAVLLDGEPVGEIDIDAWRKKIGYVSQDIFLFNGTIAENIKFYRNLTHAEVVRAAKEANIYDFIAGLPEGFDTLAGDRGVMLSGGQRQRVALARALAGQPSMLILDEATSALDTQSEQLIQEAIGNLSGKVTVFIIAHRLSTIEGADSILVLKDGRIVEQGSPAELRKNPDSYFARHAATQ